MTRKQWPLRLLVAMFSTGACLAVNRLLAPRANHLITDYALSLLGACLLTIAFLVLAGLTVRWAFWALMIVAIFYSAFYALSIVSEGVVGSGDLGHCQEFLSALNSTHLLPESRSEPPRSASFCQVQYSGTFRSPYQIVGIYGINSSGPQQQVTQLLRTVTKNTDAQPVIAVFYKGENWVRWTNPRTGLSGGQRGPEKIVRKVIIR